MTIYEAIAQMRKLTKEGKSFSFSHMTYDRTKGISNGITEVRSAKLRKRETTRYNEMAELQEAYINDLGEPRRFWHCLLLTFNGLTLTID